MPAAPPLVLLNISLPGLRETLRLPVEQMIDGDIALDDDQRARVRVLVTGGVDPLPRALVENLPALRLIVAVAAGHDGIDVDHARARGIAVTSSIGVNAPDVADLAVGSMIALVRGIITGDRLVRDGGWYPRRIVPSRSISALKVGIVGMGSIGQEISRRVAAFGCAVAWHGPRPKNVPWERAESLHALAEASDCLFLAAHLSADTRGMINSTILSALGPDAYLVNVGRGGLVDEDALLDALRAGRIGGAALDVFQEEPTPPERWRDVPNTILTPHLGGITRDAMQRVLERARQSVERGLAGEMPETVIA
ncbi:Lactate dehydrogenase [Sphingobium faniae]|nr:Lactate dehydrogenase [Sphingobium faniae]